MNQETSSSKTSSLVLSIALLGTLLCAVGIVLRPFVLPLLWAIVLSTATWPLFIRARGLTPLRPWVAALSLSLLLGLLLLIVAVPLPLELAGELRELGQQLSTMEAERITHAVAQWPLVGERLAAVLATLTKDEGGAITLVASHQADLIKFATRAARGVFETLAVIVMALVGCYFLYMYGERLVCQARAIVRKLGATRADEMFDNIGLTVRGAAYSVIATAVAQGTLAGVGYYVAGAPLPILLAICTMVMSLIPLGAPLMYVPVCVYLIFGTELPWYHGALLLAYGVLVISTIDNFLRSILISHATSVSPVIVFIGVLGGVMAFGLLGVFIGPALMGIAQTLWLDFAEE